jgi:hypothetical protein
MEHNLQNLFMPALKPVMVITASKTIIIAPLLNGYKLK